MSSDPPITPFYSPENLTVIARRSVTGRFPAGLIARVAYFTGRFRNWEGVFEHIFPIFPRPPKRVVEVVSRAGNGPLMVRRPEHRKSSRNRVGRDLFGAAGPHPGDAAGSPTVRLATGIR